MLARVPWTPPTKPKPKLKRINSDRRKHLVATAMTILRQWRMSRFEHEAACRHGLRSAFCLEGWKWSEADTVAKEVVDAALRQIGAVRPTWSQGQPEYQGVESRGAYRHCANPRCRRMLEDHQGVFCSQHCADYVTKERWRKQHAEEERIAAQFRRKRMKAEDPAAYRLRLKESRERQKERWDIRECEACRKQFKARPGRDNRFCSSKCYGSTLALPEKVCPQCGSNFRPPNKNNRTRFCSRSCASQFNVAQKRVANSFKCEPVG